MDFTKKLTLVTGGSSGIGLATACQLAAAGADVWLLARDPEKLKAAEAQVKAARKSPEQKTGTLVADVSNEAQVTSIVNAWMDQVGAPDIVVNSAGIVEPGYFEDQTTAIFHQMMDVDFFGVLHMVRAVSPAMVKRQSGHIVNISSGAGFVGWYGYSAYSSAKFAVRGLSECLRTELKPFGVKVSVVFPFDTETPQLEYDDLHKPPETKALSSLVGSPVKAEGVAKTIVKGISHGSFYIIPGIDVQALYFIYSAFPGIALPILDYMVRISLKRTNSKRQKPAKS
jgi:3-dehydrosphinganine reductase